MRNNGHQNRRNNGRHPNNNQNRNKGQNLLNRSYESNGPGVKLRGSAQNIAEKYMQLARDAQASGDLVAFENFMQHAEHYLRLINIANETMRLNNPHWRPEPMPQQEGEEHDEEPRDIDALSTRRVYDIQDEPTAHSNGQNAPQNPRFTRDHHPQKPRLEEQPASFEEGEQPRENENERRPRFNRFERNRYRNRSFHKQDEASDTPAPSNEELSPKTSQEDYGLPAFLTAPKPNASPEESEATAPPRRRTRKPRDTSQDILIAEG